MPFSCAVYQQVPTQHRALQADDYQVDVYKRQPDEVRMLDNRYALLFVRGERPVMDFKYDIMKHPNVRPVSYTHLDVYKRQRY